MARHQHLHAGQRELDAPAHEDALAGAQLRAQVWAPEPDRRDGARAVVDDRCRLGAHAAAQPDMLDLADHAEQIDLPLGCTLLAKRSDGRRRAKILVPVRVVAQQVQHGADAHAVELLDGGALEGPERRERRGGERRALPGLRIRRGWRRQPESNRRWSFCRALPYHLAMSPRACAVSANSGTFLARPARALWIAYIMMIRV